MKISNTAVKLMRNAVQPHPRITLASGTVE